jgi:hypothetical protein
MYQWLDNYMVKSPERASLLLKQSAPLHDLRQMAAEVKPALSTVRHDDGPAIVAGRGLDLSGALGCTHWECIKQEVDDLFAQVWHYFDQIVVVGPSAVHISDLWDEGVEESEIVRRLEHYIRILLYLRNIGAEDLLVFTEKFPACGVHWKESARQAGLEPVIDLSEGFAEQFLREASIEVQLAGGKPQQLRYRVLHPKTAHPNFGWIPRKRRSLDSDSVQRDVAVDVIANHIAHLVSDVEAAKGTRSPLGSVIPLHQDMLRTLRLRVGAHEEDVAFHLKLPVLVGVETETLLRVRQDEREHFIAFRDRLRAAVQERVRAAQTDDPSVIAQEVEADLINPALNDIQRRLSAARSVLVRKASASIGMGALMTTCGLLTANPLLITTGVGAVATTLPAAHKFIEDRRDVSLSDMYFLWRASQYK